MAEAVRDEERNQTTLAFDELREESIQVEEDDAICDVCFIRTFSSSGANIALYLCYICNKYLCQDCFKGHESHRFIKKSEKERMKKYFRDEMMDESESEIEEMLDGEDVSMVNRVNVKHELDKSEEYWITGVCGLDDTRWVVCDYHNDCIKLFSIGSHILQRYLRLESKPFDVTEIKVKIYVSEQSIIPTTDISVPTRSKPDNQCMLAVTLPGKRRILFINLTQNPAVITKSIETKKRCFSIDFSEDKIFTLCIDGLFVKGSFWFVSVMSTDGVTIKTINTDLHSFWPFPHLAVCPGRFYVTDRLSDKVLYMNDNDNVVSHKTIEVSGPLGISVDSDTNNVYICALGHHKLYRLDSRLESFESLVDLELVHSARPKALCIYRNRLYVSHGQESTHRNFVTVVRVL